MRHLLIALITAAAALPFLASCSATVEPNYGYYGPTPGYYAYYDHYPRYHEYHRYYHPAVVEHHEPDVHGSITVER